MSQREVVFVDAMRSAFGRMGGTIRDILPTHLGALVIKGLVEKTKITERGKVDAVMCGSAFGSVNTLNMGRWTTLAAGLPLLDACILSNFAAGVVVGEVGAASVTRKELAEAIQAGSWPVPAPLAP